MAWKDAPVPVVSMEQAMGPAPSALIWWRVMVRAPPAESWGRVGPVSFWTAGRAVWGLLLPACVGEERVSGMDGWMGI